MESTRRNAVWSRRRRTRPRLESPGAVAQAVADLFQLCRRRALYAERTGQENRTHIWSQLAQIGDCAAGWMMPLLQNGAPDAPGANALSGRHCCVIRNGRGTPGGK